MGCLHKFPNKNAVFQGVALAILLAFFLHCSEQFK